MIPAQAFRAARDFLLSHREDLAAAQAGFQWPQLDPFNWALDFFDVEAENSDRLALWVVHDDGTEEQRSFTDLSLRSNRVANLLRTQGVRCGDVLLVMLPNVAALWEITLAALKLGAVLSPAALLLNRSDLQDRLERGAVKHVITDPVGTEKFAGLPGTWTRTVVGQAAGWTALAEAERLSSAFAPDTLTRPSDPFLLYFTSGTTARPKMVLHTQQSYPVGHLSTMYWIGLRPDDLHCNISSPGWAKHAWSSFFAPWNAGAGVFVHNQARFEPRKMLGVLAHAGVTTLCAPPTVWRRLILEDLTAYPVQFRELVSAGEPLNPEVIERVRQAWGLTIRDGYGQTETTALIGNSPGQSVKAGSMGRPLPGYQIDLLDIHGKVGDEGEIGVRLQPRPAGLMTGYLDSPVRSAELLGGPHYRTADVATRDADGYYWYVGRVDDVFKSSDYRISPFEIESALLEHDVVAEAAVVPSPDPIRLCVPKAFIVLRPEIFASRETALALFRFIRGRLAGYQRVRRLEFSELPKTISGKIRRIELRELEEERRAQNERGEHEFWEEDFAELK